MSPASASTAVTVATAVWFSAAARANEASVNAGASLTSVTVTVTACVTVTVPSPTCRVSSWTLSVLASPGFSKSGDDLNVRTPVEEARSNNAASAPPAKVNVRVSPASASAAVTVATAVWFSAAARANEASVNAGGRFPSNSWAPMSTISRKVRTLSPKSSGTDSTISVSPSRSAESAGRDVVSPISMAGESLANVKSVSAASVNLGSASRFD